METRGTDTPLLDNVVRELIFIGYQFIWIHFSAHPARYRPGVARYITSPRALVNIEPPQSKPLRPTREPFGH